MSSAERFSMVAPLPPHGEWRRALAHDRRSSAPRPVVLSWVPSSVLDDPPRLAALLRDVEAAGRLHHAGAIPVVGTETLDDALVVVEAFQAGPTLRALLDAGGRLPPDVATRIAIDACAALSCAHALDAGEGRLLVHGAIAPPRLVIGEDGAARLCGFGAESGGGSAAGDVRALAAVLHECLAGERAGRPGSLDLPGIPAPLAAAVTHALDAAPPTAAAFAGALAAACPPATHASVAAYAEAIVGAGPGDAAAEERAAPPAVAAARAAEAGGPSLVVEPTDPAVAAPREAVEPTLEPLPRPPSTRPGADPAGVFAAPARAAPRSSPPLAAALVCAALGFGAGFVGSRAVLSRGGAAVPDAGAVPDAPSPPAPSAAAYAPPPAAATPAAGAQPAQPRGPRPARAAAPAPSPAAAPKRKAPPRQVRRAPAPAPAATGLLTVSAPPEAEVFLDGRRIGKGDVRLAVPVGAHRIEVRLGAASVAEAFDLAAGETWTYDVTPTQ